MTKAWEKGDSEIIDQARRKTVRTGRDVDEILKDMLKAAKAARDADRRVRIQRAQKFLKVRNKRKRRSS